jgi:hypothetical protein
MNIDNSTILGAVAVVAVSMQAKTAWGWFTTKRKERLEREERFHVSVAKLVAVLESGAADALAAKALLQGAVDACCVIAENVSLVRDATERLAGLIGTEKPGVEGKIDRTLNGAPDDVRVEMAGEIMQKIIRGKSFEEATAEANQERELADAMNSVSIGVQE